MNRTIRPVSIGLLLGIIGLLFGIFWAMYIVVNHEKIHEAFSKSAAASIKGKSAIKGDGGHAHDDSGSNHQQAGDGEGAKGRLHAPEGHGKDAGASHDHGSHPHEGDKAHDGHAGHMKDEKSVEEAVPADTHVHAMHDDPAAEAAHERLTKGHVHAMGLGILTICVSLVISLTAAPNVLKTLASACIGVGALLYPSAWIIMGYRTPSIGVEAAQESVFPIAALSVALVLAGLLICLFYLLKGMASGENQ